MSGYAFILVVPKNSGEIIHMHITGRLPEAGNLKPNISRLLSEKNMRGEECIQKLVDNCQKWAEKLLKF